MIISPTTQNIKIIEKNLNSKAQTKTYIYFINFVEEIYIQTLAYKDIKTKKIKIIKEIFMDYITINKRLFGMTNSVSLLQKKMLSISQQDDIFNTLFSLFMSLRQIPNIYYSRSVSFGHTFATEFEDAMRSQANEFPKDFSQEETAFILFNREED